MDAFFRLLLKYEGDQHFIRQKFRPGLDICYPKQRFRCLQCYCIVEACNRKEQ